MKAECIGRLVEVGISYQDAVQLRRISMTLHRWHELECGDGDSFASWCITRGRKDAGGAFEYADDGKPFMECRAHNASGARYNAIPDRESGAKKHLAKIMAGYPDHWSYVQTDPRGCALYVGRYNPATKGATDVSLLYNSGVAVYK